MGDGFKVFRWFLFGAKNLHMLCARWFMFCGATTQISDTVRLRGLSRIGLGFWGWVMTAMKIFPTWLFWLCMIFCNAMHINNLYKSPTILHHCISLYFMSGLGLERVGKQELKKCRYTRIKRQLSIGRKNTGFNFAFISAFACKHQICLLWRKEVIFILFSQASLRKHAQNCFSQLLEEMEAVFLKSNQHLSIKTLRKGSVFPIVRVRT